MDDAAISAAIENEILPQIKAQSGQAMDRAIRPTPGPSLPTPPLKQATPFYQRPVPLPGTYDPQTGKALPIPDVPMPVPNVEYQPGLPSPAIPISEQYSPEELARIPDLLMRAGNQGVMSTIGGMGTSAEALGQMMKQPKNLGLILGENREAGPLDMAVGDAMQSVGSGIKEFADRGTADMPPGFSYAGASWLKDPNLLLDPKYMTYQAGQAGGSMLSFLMPTLSVLGKTKWATGASSVLESMTNAAETYDNAIKKGATPDQAAQLFATNLIADVPFTYITNKLGVFNEEIKNPLLRAATGTALETLQEPGQGGIQRATMRAIDPNQSITEGMDVEALGGLLGGPVGSVLATGTEQGHEPPPAPPPARQEWKRGPQQADAGLAQPGQPTIQEIARRRAEARQQFEQQNPAPPTPKESIASEPIQPLAPAPVLQEPVIKSQEIAEPQPVPEPVPPPQPQPLPEPPPQEELQPPPPPEPQPTLQPEPETIPPPVETKAPQPETEPPPAETKKPQAETAATPERRLINRVKQALQSNEDISRSFQKLADEAYGGSRAEGKYQMKQAYDAAEAAVNEHLAETPGLLDSEESLGKLRSLLTKLPTQSVRSSQQEQLQQFSTPPTLSWLTDKVAAPQKDDVVMEPSAGTGSLTAMLRPMVKEVWVNEIDPGRRALLKEQGYEHITDADAEHLDGTLDAKGVHVRPSLIVMNPPFSATGGRVKNNKNKFGYAHVRQALQRLAPGGRLVAILGEGSTLTAPTARSFWMEVKKTANLRANVGISGKEYAKYGTTFGNRLIVIDKNGPTTEEPVQENFDTIEEAWNALRNIAADRGARPGNLDQAPQPADRGPDLGRPEGPVSPNPGEQGQQVRPGGSGRDDLPAGGRSEGGIGVRTGPGRGPENRTPSPAPVQPELQPEGPRQEQRPSDDRSGVRSDGPEPRRVDLPQKPVSEGEIDARTAEIARQRAADARKRLLERRNKKDESSGPVAGMGNVAEDDWIKEGWDDLADVGAGYFADGMAPKEWRARMVEEFGDEIKPHLMDLMDTAIERFQAIRAEARKQFQQQPPAPPTTPPGPEPTPQPAPKPRADTQEAPPTESEQEEEGGSFVRYQPTIEGAPHPSPLVETRVMASVEPPSITYRPKLPETTVDEGRVSAAQLEAIARAGMMHQQFDGEGRRQAALVGDGTGVGKGREMAGIIFDNFLQGRKRAVWVSAAADLMGDAKRDFAGIGAVALLDKLRRLNDWAAADAIDMAEGVIFTTYDTLRSGQSKQGGKTRLQQLIDWGGQDLVIVFDEVHKAKNAIASITGEDGTLSGRSVAEIQEKLPKAYVTYASATFASEPRHLSALERLGLWGKGTAFQDFGAFMTEIGRGKVAALELIARELKAMGAYLSRSISYKGVTYDEVTHQLTPEQRKTYQTAAEAWQTVMSAMWDQLEKNGAGRTGRARAAVEQRFWSDHQRFFRNMLTAMKLPTVIQLTEKALEDGKSVVISLIGTGDAQAKRQMDKPGSGEGEGKGEGIDFSPREILLNLIDSHYPVEMWEEYTDDSGKTHRRKVIRDGKPVINPEAERAKKALKEKLKSELALPDAPLQAIVNHFGRQSVAELTGRVDEPQVNDQGKLVKASRAPEGVPKDAINEYEMDQFQSGKKRVAVISKAAGTGISLHAELRAKNQQPRFHIVMELSWSADDQMQSFGRTHRSNQKQPPEYVIVSSDIGGEKRFSSTIAKRLDALGALTKGQRGTAGAAVLAKYNFETEQGAEAAKQFYTALYNGEVEFEHNDPHDVLLKMGVTEQNDDETLKPIPKDTQENVTRLLNRILNLAPDEQNEVYDYFTRVFETAVDRAMQAGTLDTGVQEVKGDRVVLADQRAIASNPKTGAKTYRYRLEVDRKNKPMSVDDAKAAIQRGNAQTLVDRNNGQIILARKTDVTTTDQRTGVVDRIFIIARPEHYDPQDKVEFMTGAELGAQYVRTGGEEEAAWHKAVAEEEEAETAHGTAKQRLADYKKDKSLPRYLIDDAERQVEVWKSRLDAVREKKISNREKFHAIQNTERWEKWEKQAKDAGPKRTDTIHMIGGSVLHVWNQLNPTGGRLDIRMAYPEGKPSVVGLVMAERQANWIEKSLTGTAPAMNAVDVFNAVMEGNENIPLAQGMRIQRSSINRKPVLRFLTQNERIMRTLRDLGVIHERIGWEHFFYLPNNLDQAAPILGQILQQFPVQEDDSSSGGTASYAPQRNTPTAGGSSTATQSAMIQRRSEAVKGLSELFGIPIRKGRFRERAAGIYKVKPEVIRLKEALDLPVLAHEVGHHIHKFLWGTRNDGLDNRPLRQWASELRPLDYDQKKRRLHEGFAEFLRYWMTDPKQAQAKAPQFYAFFEKTLASHPDLKAGLELGRDRIMKWMAQPSAARVLGSISREKNERRPFWYYRTFDEFYSDFVDRRTALRTAVDDMMKRGPKVSTEKNAADLAQLMSGWWGKPTEFLYNKTFNFKDLSDRGMSLRDILHPVARTGITLGDTGRLILQDQGTKDFEDGLNDLRIYLVAQRVLEKTGQQGIETGISVDDARNALMELDKYPERMKDLRVAAARLWRYQNDLVQYLVDARMLNADQANRMRALNRSYVPFYRAIEGNNSSSKAGSGQLANVADPVKKMTGSTREIIDPLESIIKNTYALISAAERNHVALTLAEQAEMTDGAGKWMELVPPDKYPTRFKLEEIASTLKKAGMDLSKVDLETVATIWRPRVDKDRSENILTVVKDGQRMLYEVSPELYEALDPMDRASANILIRIGRFFARPLRAGATQLSPDFVISNPTRDAWTAFMQSEVGFVPLIDTIRGAYHRIKETKEFHEWRRAGGEHSALISLDRTNLQKKLTDVLDAKGKSYYAKHPAEAAWWITKALLTSPLNTVGAASEAMEAASRLGEYVKVRKGASARQSALSSRNVTDDFARAGRIGQVVNQVIPFFNANLQGLDRFVRLHQSRHLQRTIQRGVLFITLPSLLLWWMNKDDPDYQEMPNYIKDFFWLVPTKWSPWLHAKTPFIPIPKPFLWGQVYGTLWERGMDAAYRKNPKAFEGWGKSLGDVSLPSFVPPVMSVPLAVTANYDFFTEQPIDPDSGGGKKDSSTYNVKPGTSRFSRELAIMAKRLGWTVSPNKIDYTIFGFTGGLGKSTVRVVDWFLPSQVPEPSPRLADIPVVRKFTVPNPPTYPKSMRQMYDEQKELNARKADAKQPREPAFTSEEAQRLQRMNSYAKRVAAFRRQLREVQQSPTLSPAEKRSQIDALQKQMNSTAREAVAP